MARKTFRASVPALFLSFALAISPSLVVAQDDDQSLTGDRGTDMAVDIVIARPAGLIATAVGSVLWVVALPFTLPTGSAGDAARELVVAPAQYTFKRRLGDFGHCGIGTSCTAKQPEKMNGAPPEGAPKASPEASPGTAPAAPSEPSE